MVELHCKATGIPAPSVNMYHHNLSITSEVPSDRTQVLKNLVVNQATAGEYFCIASNTHVSSRGGEQRHFVQKVISVEIIGEES